MQLEIFDSISKIDSVEWNNLVADNNPLLSFEFLSALETQQCLGEKYGWFPVFFTLYENNKLQAACPCYIKSNTYGEFVFDNAWSDFYHKHKVDYFPKLVCSIPYTPTTSERFLFSKELNLADVSQTFSNAIHAFCVEQNLSGAHVLFNPIEENQALETQNWITRKSCQYHWLNKNYQSFDDFLAEFNCKKRKNVKRERKSIAKQKLSLKQIYGEDLSDEELEKAYYYYESTFDKKWGTATLTLDFFKTIAKTLPKRMMVVFAYRDVGMSGRKDSAGGQAYRDVGMSGRKDSARGQAIMLEDKNNLKKCENDRKDVRKIKIMNSASSLTDKTVNSQEHLNTSESQSSTLEIKENQPNSIKNIIACSIFFISDTTLYGRYWGCDDYYDNLHFEACYYQGIEYCIKNNLSFYEPGAQGEHKIPRGFLPVTTYSSHWLKDEQFFNIIKDHVKNENPLIMEHCDDLKKMSPFKT